MATNILYIGRMDRGAAGREFDHHGGNGGRGICQQQIARRAGYLTKFFKCPGFARGMLAAEIGWHIILMNAAFIRGRRLIE